MGSSGFHQYRWGEKDATNDAKLSLLSRRSEKNEGTGITSLQL